MSQIENTSIFEDPSGGLATAPGVPEGNPKRRRIAFWFGVVLLIAGISFHFSEYGHVVATGGVELLVRTALMGLGVYLLVRFRKPTLLEDE